MGFKMSQDYYFMSVGEKSYFYTLNYSYIEIHYSQNEFGICGQTPVRKYSYIQNLSHDFEQALEKAKQWHKAHGGTLRLKLMDSPNAMSEREQVDYIQRMERIKQGLFNKGKYANQHVNTVPKSYVHWYLCNMYVPELSEGDQNLNAQICYNYADEQGWIEDWAEKGKQQVFPQGYEQYLNDTINGDIMLVGRYAEQPFEDYAYTKKKTLRVSVEDYLYWFANQETAIEEIIKKFELKPELAEDGQEYYTLTSEHFLSDKGRKPSDFELSVLTVRKFLSQFNKNRPYPQYRFDWKGFQMPTHKLIAFCPKSEIE